MSEQYEAHEDQVVRIRRTHLVRKVVQYDFIIPAKYDIHEWMANDFKGLDERLCEEGMVDGIWYKPVDDDDLDLEVVK